MTGIRIFEDPLMRIQVITLFPEEFTSLVNLGVTGRGIREGKVQL